MTFDEVVSSARRCRFPVGVNARGDEEWCGHDTGSPRASWCPEHRAVVFLPEERLPHPLRLATIAGSLRARDRVPGRDPQPGWRSDRGSREEEEFAA